MKKILFVINTLDGGGAERVLVDLVNSLDRNAFEITVQTFWDTGVYLSALAEHIQYKSIIRVRNPFFRRILSKICISMLPTQWLYNWFVKADYDYEVAFLEGFPTKIIACSTNEKAKKFAWLHIDLVQFSSSEEAFSKKILEQDAYNKMDRIICVSESVRKSLLKKYTLPEDKTMVLYNIVDDTQIREKGNEKCELEAPHPLLVSVGRLTEQKAFDRLLRVHKRLMDDGLDHNLWIIGEGEKRAQLEEYIRENELSRVSLLGFQKNPYAYMSKADLFISSSVAEGFSTVITESVILGVPVISTNTAGAYEPAEAPRCSAVVDDEEALYEAIGKVLRNKAELEKIKAEVKTKQSFFKKERFLEKIQALFSE